MTSKSPDHAGEGRGEDYKTKQGSSTGSKGTGPGASTASKAGKAFNGKGKKGSEKGKGKGFEQGPDGW